MNSDLKEYNVEVLVDSRPSLIDSLFKIVKGFCDPESSVQDKNEGENNEKSGNNDNSNDSPAVQELSDDNKEKTKVERVIVTKVVEPVADSSEVPKKINRNFFDAFFAFGNKSDDSTSSEGDSETTSSVQEELSDDNEEKMIVEPVTDSSSGADEKINRNFFDSLFAF